MKSPRNGLSVHGKIFGVTFATCALVVVSITLYFSRLGFADADRALESKASTYTRELAHQVESAVAFDDRETAREAFEALAVDPDVSGLALYLESGRLLEARGEVTWPGKGAAYAAKPQRVAGGIISAAQVVSREGPRGTVVVQMSTAAVDRQRRALLETALGASSVALLVSFVAAWVLARSIAQRLTRLARSAGQVAAGDIRAQAFVDEGGDEIGRLAAAFGSMVENVSALMIERETSAAGEQLRLETLVIARTTALAERTRRMRILLDNVNDGFVVIELDGTLGSERSAMFDRWFAGTAGNAHVLDLLRSCDPAVAEWFELAWEALLEGTLPLEVAAAQFPATLCAGERTYDLTVTPIVDESGALANALLVVRDATEQLEHARAEATQREVLGLLEVALDDRSAFVQFVAEGNAIVQRVTDDAYASDVEMKRDIHTLKGNAGLFGVSSVAACCHALEDTLDERDVAAMDSVRDELRTRWTSVTARLASVFAKTTLGRLDIERAAFDSLIRAIDGGTARSTLVRSARLLRLESVSARLAGLGDQGAALAVRLGKDVEIVTAGDDLHFDPAAWRPFWSSLAHAMRNAIHHGIEGADERVRAGKRATGRIELRAHTRASSFILDVSDDGRGIDWQAIAARASALGLPTDSAEDLREALFADGVSAVAAVSDLAGRGVGMAALRAACVALGGACRVISSPGAGTTFRFVFPVGSLGDAYRQDVDDAAEREVA